MLAGIAVLAWGLLLIAGPVDWDLGWQMHLADQILDGKKLYVDVGATEQHPPLYTWICVIATFVARIIHVDEIRFFLTLTVIASIAASVAAVRIARGGALLFAAFGAASLAVHGVAGGSGEQLSTALSLPYLAAAAASMHGRTFSKRHALALGLAAGFGMAMKPHYALVWLLTEIAVALHHRSWRSLLRIESVSTASVWVVYIAATLLFTPAYIHAAMQAAAYYGAFMNQTLLQVLALSPWMFMCAAWLMWVFIRKQSEYETLASLLLIAALAMYIGGVVQMKGWYHHWTPAIGLSIAGAIALWPRRFRTLALLLLIAGSSYRLYHSQWEARYWQKNGPTYLPAMQRLLAAHAPHGPLLIFDNGLAIGFPLVNFTKAVWTLPESCLWMVAGLYEDQWEQHRPIVYHTPDQWVPFEKEVHDLIWRGVQERPPKLVLFPSPVADDKFDFRKFVETDPRMKNYLADWVPTDRVGPHIVLQPPGSVPHPAGVYVH